MASIAILGVAVVRLMLRKAPKIFSYVLWSVVLFRLLCPFSISTPFSIINVNDFTVKSINHKVDDKDIYYVENVGSVNEGTLYVDNIGSVNEGPLDLYTSRQERDKLISREFDPMSESMAGAAGYAKTESLSESKNVTGSTSFMKSLPVLAMLWIVGMTVFLSINMAGFLRIKRRVSASLHVRDNIYIADGVESPFCMGLVKPQIYLPSSIAEDEKAYVILHEQHHIKRLDHVIKLIAFVALGIHWFNPLVWVAFVLAGKDMEMSCDEAVIKQMNENDRSAYAMSLLKLATGRRNLQVSTLSFGEGDPKERIKNVMNYKKATFVVMVSAVTLCIVFGIILGTNRTKQDELENIEHTAEEKEIKEAEVNHIKESHPKKNLDLAEFDPERKTIYGNIDDNPIVEYAIFYGDAFNIMDFYFNGEMVYHHEDLLKIQMDETHIAYVDLDHDGEKELFLPILPAVNSMPLTEYAIIKNIDGVWTKLEVYQGEDTRDNTFPIHAVREDDEYTIAVYCDGLLDHKRTFSMEPAYNYRKEKAEQGEDYAQEVVNFYEQEVFSKGIGEEVGQICAWGVWSIHVDTYDGQPCLRAEQGIQGDGKFDIWTCVNIYFDYDQQGKIHLLDLQLEPK